MHLMQSYLFLFFLYFKERKGNVEKFLGVGFKTEGEL